jgi:hypothetical protein
MWLITVESYIHLGLLITMLVTVRHEWYNLLEDQNKCKIIPWEVDLLLIMHILQDFSMAMGA